MVLAENPPVNLWSPGLTLPVSLTGEGENAWEAGVGMELESNHKGEWEIVELKPRGPADKSGKLCLIQ